MEAFTAGGAGAELVEEDFGARLAGADDGEVVGGEQPFAVVEVVGGVDDGDGGGVGEGRSGTGMWGVVPMPRTRLRA